MKILDYDGLKAKGIKQCKIQIWRWEKAGTFPAPVKIGHRNGWTEDEVDRWLAERIAERDAKGEAA